MESFDDLAALNLGIHGARLYPQALSEIDIAELRALADPILAGQSGARIFGGEIAAAILAPKGALQRIATGIMGDAARPVRAILFDKNADANWSAGWHQDRTIAVRERRETEGYGPWSVKGGAVHVEPPFEILSTMITMRAHLDDCDRDNAPLLVAPGSHRLGRVRLPEIDATAKRLGAACCLARAGDVWAHATAIIHASERAHRPRRRRVLQIDFSANALPAGLEWLGIAGDQ